MRVGDAARRACESLRIVAPRGGGTRILPGLSCRRLPKPRATRHAGRPGRILDPGRQRDTGKTSDSIPGRGGNERLRQIPRS